ncbi:MAG: group II intron reverse transcriptase/maturase [Deltaproteobacteria bacterium RIFOXYB12_FULL_58_9]|nr:MAG: group II intron reverse transcriptase/maturase [Deltaproteobacteria bacterium RIFOXYB12_FULL_58_9]
MSPELMRVAEAARKNPNRKLLSLAHHLDVDALRRAYKGIRRNAAVGVDGVTKEAYGENLESNLRALHGRLKTMQYRHQAIRRVYIEKDGGKQRPIGISCLEDKIVQDALRELLEAIYEQDFLNCSHGFRPGRSAHDALRALNHAIRSGRVNSLIEADIVSCFDRIERPKLKNLLEQRIADKSLMRLIGKCLHVGVLEAGADLSSELGTVQGSTLSPLLANVYLHHALDVWFEQEVCLRLKGKAVLIRYCDDFVIGCARQDDAEQVMQWLRERLGLFGLELHPKKTRLLDFRRPHREHRGKGPSTFDFLGFTHFWRRTILDGSWQPACKTRVERLRRAKKAVEAWCNRHRHQSVREQHVALVRRIQGHFNYFGVRGNLHSLDLLASSARRSWFKWLTRRSQRTRLTWKRFGDLMKDYPFPRPKERLCLWGSA